MTINIIDQSLFLTHDFRQHDTYVFYMQERVVDNPKSLKKAYFGKKREFINIY